jgi:hypothetical protein
MTTEMALEMFVYSSFNHLMQLLAREYFVEKALCYNMWIQKVFQK